MTQLKRNPRPASQRSKERGDPENQTLDSIIAEILGVSTPVTAQKIRIGFHPSVVERLSLFFVMTKTGVLGHLKLSARTYARRKKLGRLTMDESDRAWRMANLGARAYQLLGEKEAAANWLDSSNPFLDGESPLDRADSIVGMREVERLIGRISHGIPS